MSVVNYETGELVELIHLRTDAVTIVDRYRSDFGDIDGLAASIREVGLLQPILVSPTHELIAGERRLRAAQQLNMRMIPARVVSNLDDAVMRLKAERDENTCRKEMTVSELMSIGKRLEELERPKATRRQQSAQFGAGQLTRTASNEPPRRTREVVGEALGISSSTYDRARRVIDATEDEDPAVREVAYEALKEMDRTGKVNTGAEKIRAIRKPPTKPKASPKYGTRRKHDQVIRNIVTALEGLSIAADEITVLDHTVTNEEAARLADDLSKQIRSLNRIKTLLKEHSK